MSGEDRPMRKPDPGRPPPGPTPGSGSDAGEPACRPGAEAAADRGLGGCRDVAELERRELAVEGLLAVAAAVSSQLGAGNLAHEVARVIHDTLHVADCDIWKLEGAELCCAASWDDDGLDAGVEGTILSADNYPTVREAVDRRTAVWVADGTAVDVPAPEREVLDAFGYRSFVTVPLVVGDRVVGIIEAYDRRPRDPEEMLPFVQDVGHLVAGAFQNAWLAERLGQANADLRTLVEAGLLIDERLAFPEAMAEVAERVCEATRTASCDLYVIEGSDLRAVAAVLDGRREPEYVGSLWSLKEYPVSRGAIERREIVVVEDSEVGELDTVELAAMREWDYRARACVPLLVDGEIAGLLELSDRRPRSWTHEMDLLRGLAQIAARALRNWQQLNALEAANRRLALVHEVGLELTSTLEVERVLASAAERLCAAIDVGCCDIYLRRDHDRLRCVASITNGTVDEEWIGRSFSLGLLALTGEVLESGVPAVVESTNDPRLSEHEAREMRAWGERSGMIVPLRFADASIGTCELYETRRQRVFTAEEVATVEAVCRVAALAIENAGQYEHTRALHLDNLRGLASALTAKDHYSLGHAARVSAYMVMIGRDLGWPEGFRDRIEEAAYLHDIGKIAIADRILLKQGRLNEDEWAQVRRHPEVSADILHPLFPEDIVAVVRHHHERYDGDGYPEGLHGEGIPEAARAMAVVDAFDAMSYARPYREALDLAGCVGELEDGAGGQFDPRMVAAFREVLDGLGELRARARAVARWAAERLDTGDLERLARAADDEGDERRVVTQALRDARDRDERVRHVELLMRRGKTYTILAEADATPGDSAVGEEVFADEDLRRCFAGEPQDVLFLVADQWGVWVSCAAAVPAGDRRTAFAVLASVPALPDRTGGVRSDSAQPLASLLHAAAVRLTRAELDAITDGLTGLYNHRYLQDRLGEEIALAAESGRPVAVLFCDLDRFKDFNDRFGHRRGDAVLQGAARAMERCVRRGDFVARYGGEELVVVVPGAEQVVAVGVAERIRAQVAGLRVEGAAAGITISVGVALYPEHGAARDEVLAAADKAMYAAKAAGRDAVAVAAAAKPVETARATPLPPAAPEGDRRRRGDRRTAERRSAARDRRTGGPQGPGVNA